MSSLWRRIIKGGSDKVSKEAIGTVLIRTSNLMQI